MKSNKARVVDFALTDREIEEPEEGEEGAEGTEAEAVVDAEEGLSPNAEKVQEFADTLAAEIEAEDIAVSDDAEGSDKNEEDEDI